MPVLPLEDHLSLDSLVFVMRSIGSEDENLRNEARKFLQKQGSPAVEKKIRTALEASGKPSGRFKPTEVALADMDLLYNLGVIEKDLYRTPRDGAHITTAINHFSNAWEGRKYASEAAKVFFAKSLYGWALTLADRSVVDRDDAGRKKPELTAAVRDKFAEFIRAAETRPGGQSIPHPMKYSRRSDI
jgi:hypothetical protein